MYPQRGYTIYLVGHERRPLLRDAYHTFLRVPWLASLGFNAAAYALINLVFAVVYLEIGGVANAAPGSFFDALIFSVQTLSTVGFGNVFPQSSAANTAMMVESIIGIITIALATGLIFAKFSRASARIAFSSCCVVTQHDGQPALMFRLGNRRGNTIYDARIRVVASRRVTTSEGEAFYKIFDLPVTRDHQIGLKRGWTVIHVIDSRSALNGLDSPAALAAAEVELAVSLTGIDDTSMQQVTVIHEYADTDIKFGVRFADTLTPLPGGDLMFDQRNFDVVVPAATPHASVPA